MAATRQIHGTQGIWDEHSEACLASSMQSSSSDQSVAMRLATVPEEAHLRFEQLVIHSAQHKQQLADHVAVSAQMVQQAAATPWQRQQR
jgi:hypothetical protein